MIFLHQKKAKVKIYKCLRMKSKWLNSINLFQTRKPSFPNWSQNAKQLKNKARYWMSFSFNSKLKDKRLQLPYKRWNLSSLHQKNLRSNPQLKKREKMTKTSRHQSTQKNLTSAQWNLAQHLLKRLFKVAMIKTLLKKIGWAKEEDKNKIKMKTWAVYTYKNQSKVPQRRVTTKTPKVKHPCQSPLSKGWGTSKTKRTKRIKRILRPHIENLLRKFWKVERQMLLQFLKMLQIGRETLRPRMSFRWKKSNWVLGKRRLDLKVFWILLMRTACQSRLNSKRKNLSNRFLKF